MTTITTKPTALQRLRALASRRPRPGRPAPGQPTRTPRDRCAADPCTVVDNPFADDRRYLPSGAAQLARCTVPAQDDRVGHLKAGDAVRNARPDLTPVWCAGTAGKPGAWYHSACYSTHTH